MNSMRLNISNLSLDLDLSRLKNRVRYDLYAKFYSFIDKNGQMPHETLNIIPVKSNIWKRYSPDYDDMIKHSLKIPLSKFPFVADKKKERDRLYMQIRPYFKDELVRGFLNGAGSPADFVFFPLAGSCLIRNTRKDSSALFIKSRSRAWAKIASISSSVYFSASMALPLLDSLLLHGVGITRKEKGLLFLGLPGDGKTTLAGFSAPEDVVSDDGIIVERKGKGFFLAPTPFDPLFLMRQRIRSFSDQRVRLCMGFFLKKSNKVHLERVPPSEAGSIILKNHIHFFRYFPKKHLEKAFYLTADICRQIPFYRLYFRKDDTFWSEIDNRLSTVK